MTKDEIITVAKCCIVDTCESCPLVESGNCIINFMKHILEYMKTEPAPAATDTSSEVVSKIPVQYYTLMIAQKQRFVKHTKLLMKLVKI